MRDLSMRYRILVDGPNMWPLRLFHVLAHIEPPRYIDLFIKLPQPETDRLKELISSWKHMFTFRLFVPGNETYDKTDVVSLWGNCVLTREQAMRLKVGNEDVIGRFGGPFTKIYLDPTGSNIHPFMKKDWEGNSRIVGSGSIEGDVLLWPHAEGQFFETVQEIGV